MTVHEAWSPDLAAGIIKPHIGSEGPLLPILHDLQAAFGCVPEAAVPLVADALNLSRAEVHGVVTFYHDFRREPAGRHVLKMCRAEACQAAGGEALAAQAEGKLCVKFGDTSADGRITLEPIYCLGLCSVSPSAMLDGKLHARLDQTKLDALIAQADR
jgi:formate dehydrogenase subunit gamma